MRQARGDWGQRTGAVLVLLLGSSPLLGSQEQEPRPAVGSRVRMASPLATAAVRSSVQRAGERLRRPECQRVFSDFADGSGTSLQARLDELGQSGESYLDLVLFRDGSGTPACARRGLAAYTSPGSRVVWVCADAYVKTAGVDPVLGEALLIHELLHSLGLGEGPPSAEEITARVLERCGLSGKAVALEPATGFTFDTTMVPKFK